MLLGIVSYQTMPRAEDPMVQMPLSSITVISPGIHPEDMESLVVEPLEQAINQLEDIRKITTNIEEGMTRLSIEYIYGVDADEKFNDVQTAVAGVRAQLPDNVRQVILRKESPNDVPIVQLALTSEQQITSTILDQ